MGVFRFRGGSDGKFQQTEYHISVSEQTYISFVEAVKDKFEQVGLFITGRGFREGGPVSKVIIDKDGEAPYDYEYYFKDDAYKVVSDRRIEGPLVVEVNEGIYYIGVTHPVRGTVTPI